MTDLLDIEIISAAIGLVMFLFRSKEKGGDKLYLGKCTL